MQEPSLVVREQLALAHSAEAVKATSGPLEASFPPRVEALQSAWVETWGKLGLQNDKDAFHGDALGGHTSTCHVSASTKQRTHAGEAFLASVADRPNLTIITGALVEAVDFAEREGKRTATGVRYTKGGKTLHIVARKKVILAAGTFLSPALLERSGIGDSQHLSTLGVPLNYHNAAVGENLQDHIRGSISFEAADDAPLPIPIPDEEARKMYERDRSGPWGERLARAFSYMPLPPLLNDESQVHLDKVLNGVGQPAASGDFTAKHRSFVKAQISDPAGSTATAFLTRRPAIPPAGSAQQPSSGAVQAPTRWISLEAMLSHPLSRGSVHITSPSSQEKPTIRANYYSDPTDLEVHALVLKALTKVAATPPLSDFIKRDGEHAPADSSLDGLKAHLKKYTGTNYHPTGTCSMLPEEFGGVVDSRLKVYGTENLHVVDASVMPVVPRCNIITTVYAIAERAADMLAEDLGLIVK